MAKIEGAVETQRLFFALWPDAVVQERLANAAAAVLTESQGRRVATGHIHCTLIFLGQVNADQRACVEAVADSVRGEPFSLHIDRFGFFRRPQVAWLGCAAPPARLKTLVAQLGQGCDGCGFPPETRPYSVHLTIARKVRRDPGRPPIMAIDWEVDRFALIESIGTPEGVRYRPLRFWTLARG